MLSILFSRKGEIGMEIERINENTVKFFLSYIDIEERGFTREEVWYNRDKSEELFWDMMDEINEEAEFEVEGPLWIQVHAMNNGIEVTVTRAQNGEDHPQDPPFEQDDPRKLFQHAEGVFDADEEVAPDGVTVWSDNTFYFTDFEEIIRLSKRIGTFQNEANTSLYFLEDTYYLHVAYDEETMDEKRKTDMFSILSEFGTSSNMTIHRLEEYGDIVMKSDVFGQIKKYF